MTRLRLIVLAASVFFSLGGIWSEEMHGITGFQRAAGRAPFAVLLQLLTMWRAPLAGVSWKSALLGGIFGLHLVTYFTGMILIHPAIAMLLVSTGPMFAPLIDIAIALIRRVPIQIARRELIVAAILWVMVTAFLLFGQLTREEQVGAVLSLCTSLLWSICMMLNTSDAERNTGIAMGNIATYIVALSFSPGFWPAMNTNINWLIVFGAVSSGLPHCLLSYARNKFENPQEILMIQTIQPILTFVFVGAYFHFWSQNKWPSKLAMYWGASLLVILLVYFESKRREKKRLMMKV